MSILAPTGLETADYGTLGWNYIYSTNFQKLNEFLSYFPRLWDVSSYTNNDGDILVFSSSTNSWSSAINKNDLVFWIDLDSDSDGLIDVNKIKQGSGSGLDADMLDGFHSSDFMFVSDYVTNNKINLSVLLNEGVSVISSDFIADESVTTILADASANAITITLPENPTVGKKYIIKKLDNVNTVTVTINGIILIDNSTSISLTNQFDVISVIFSGSQYYII